MDLQFDKMVVDTTLAQAFLEGEEYMFTQIINTKMQDCVTIDCDGGMFCNDFPSEETTGLTVTEKIQVMQDFHSKLRNFAKELKANTNLIAQLEYLKRKIPVEDTISQVNLIIQQILYVASLPNEERPLPVLNDYIIMKNDSPLLMLGYIAKIFQYQQQCTLIGEDTMAPICYLFTTLCHKADLLIITKLLQPKAHKIPDHLNVPTGAIGIISEFSDIDSAVDAFLSSSKHVPWRLRRILVQESVYRQFQDALSWKCNLYKTDDTKNYTSSSDAIEYNDRVFLIDTVLIEAESTSVIVEAYRTKKELNSLLSQYQTYYVSLWASDIAEINEISHSIQSPVVWVNNFGDFRGPPSVSEAIYSHGIFGLCVSESKFLVRKLYITKLSELKRSWLKLDFEARCKILCNVLDECATTEPANECYSQLKEHFHKTVIINRQDAFINVAKDYVCLGLVIPSNELLYMDTDNVSVELFESILRGNAFLIRKRDEYAHIFGKLIKAGAPLVFLEECDISTNDSTEDLFTFTNTQFICTQTTKVIWTNNGTVFAN